MRFSVKYDPQAQTWWERDEGVSHYVDTPYRLYVRKRWAWNLVGSFTSLSKLLAAAKEKARIESRGAGEFFVDIEGNVEHK